MQNICYNNQVYTDLSLHTVDENINTFYMDDFRTYDDCEIFLPLEYQRRSFPEIKIIFDGTRHNLGFEHEKYISPQMARKFATTNHLNISKCCEYAEKHNITYALHYLHIMVLKDVLRNSERYYFSINDNNENIGYNTAIKVVENIISTLKNDGITDLGVLDIIAKYFLERKVTDEYYYYWNEDFTYANLCHYCYETDGIIDRETEFNQSIEYWHNYDNELNKHNHIDHFENPYWYIRRNVFRKNIKSYLTATKQSIYENITDMVSREEKIAFDIFNNNDHPLFTECQYDRGEFVDLYENNVYRRQYPECVNINGYLEKCIRFTDQHMLLDNVFGKYKMSQRTVNKYISHSLLRWCAYEHKLPESINKYIFSFITGKF